MTNSKTALITGSNRGIGKATASFFAQRGWNVIAHARKKNDEFEMYLWSLKNQYHVDAMPIYFDMCDADEMKKQITEVIFKPKIKIDALINNAGVCAIKLFLLSSMADIRKTFDVNLFSHMRLTQLILKRMDESSAIVNVASIDGLEPKRGESAYATSKAALIAWTEVLRQELVGRIRVNAVAPHAVNTDMARGIENQAVWKGSQIMEAQDIAKVIYFLCSDDAKAITGEVCKITGTIV